MNRLLLAGAGMLFSCSTAFATVLYDLPLKSDGDLKKMTKEEKAPAAIRITDLPGTGSVLEISIPKESEISRCSANLPLKGSDIAGKRIVISVDAKNDMVMREKKWGAGWISVHGFVPPGKKSITIFRRSERERLRGKNTGWKLICRMMSSTVVWRFI